MMVIVVGMLVQYVGSGRDDCVRLVLLGVGHVLTLFTNGMKCLGGLQFVYHMY